MSADPVKKLRALAADAPAYEPPQSIDGSDAVLGELLYAFLLWEAGARTASNALKRLRAEVVDANEFRICTPDEIVAILGPRYPRAKERGERLHACLNAIYEREHSLSLESLHASPKRETRSYLDSLPGVPPFVAARVFLLAIGGHAFPVDQRLAAILAGLELGEPDMDELQRAAWMERQVRAGESRDLYLALEHAAESPGVTRKKPAARSTSKAAGSRSSRSASKPATKPTKKPSSKSKSRSSKAAGKK
ncbi:MAG: hypothetical protein ACF8SC_06900 [Phycisphaerales bacterium JB037]